jgi:hypothetical protein
MRRRQCSRRIFSLLATNVRKKRVLPTVESLHPHCFHCLSFSFFFFSETRLFRGLRGLTAEKFFCASVWASSTGGHASHARRPNWGFDGQPSVLLSRRHETHSTGASRNRLRFVRRNLAVAARRRAQASAITAVFPRRRAGFLRLLIFVRMRFGPGCRLREEPSEVAMQGNGRQGVWKNASFDPRSKSAAAVARPRLQPQMTVLFPPNSLNAAALPFGEGAKSQSRPLRRLGARTMVRPLSAGLSGPAADWGVAKR